jgi:ferredoxin-NADP reductase
MAPVHKKAHVRRVQPLSASVRALFLEAEGGPIRFAAGQWVNLHVPTAAGPCKRAYSVASAPGDELLELAVTRVEGGAASPTLHALEPGALLELDGPHGFFTREGAVAEQPALFVATGTGLAPFRSMLRDRRGPAPITLLFGCRSEADILWRDELEELARSGAIRLEVTLSQGSPGWSGRRGYVQRHVPELAAALGAPHVFVCGLNRMVSEVRAVCKEQLGYDRRRIHSERYD